jgi:polyisoprenoid-binding protein YceI
MKRFILFAFLAFGTTGLFAQKKTTTSAVVSFDATTALDNLPKADNKTVIAAVDTKTGTVQFEAAVKNFAFANPKIQEHFNASGWMNSDEYPKFSFNGKIADLSKVNFSKNGTYAIEVTGDLTVKNIAKELSAPGKVVVKDGTITASSEFTIKLEDYNISGTPINVGKVAREPKITVLAELK